MMRGMRELMQRQQQLLDRSFRAQQQAEQGQMGMPGGQAGSAAAGQARSSRSRRRTPIWATPPGSRRRCAARSAR